MNNLTQLLTRLKELHERAGPLGNIANRPDLRKQIELYDSIPLLLEVIETQREAMESVKEDLMGCGELWARQSEGKIRQALARCEKVIQEGMK